MTCPAQPALSHPPALAGDVTVETPKHPVHALTTYELRDYRRELERAIIGIAPDAPVQSLSSPQARDSDRRAGRPRPAGPARP